MNVSLKGICFALSLGASTMIDAIPSWKSLFSSMKSEYTRHDLLTDQKNPRYTNTCIANILVATGILLSPFGWAAWKRYKERRQKERKKLESNMFEEETVVWDCFQRDRQLQELFGIPRTDHLRLYERARALREREFPLP